MEFKPFGNLLINLINETHDIDDNKIIPQYKTATLTGF
jgi:hypothetical protein